MADPQAAPGPWTKYQPSSQPSTSPAGPWSKYGGSSGKAGAAMVSSSPAVRNQTTVAMETQPTSDPGAVSAVAQSAPQPTGTAALGINRSGSQLGMTNKPTFDDFMQGAEAWARGASFGTSDDASAALAAAILKAKGNPHTMRQLYDALDNEENQRIDDYEAKNGKGAEYLGMAMGPGVVRLGRWIGQGAGWATRALRASLSGAGGAAATDIGYAKPSEKVDPGRTAKAAGIGAVVGPVVQGATEVVAPPISQAAQYLIDRGVRPTIGQLMGGAAKATEDKLTSIPLTGDLIKNNQRAAIEQFNRATLNNVLEPIGVQVDPAQAVGRDGYQVVHGILDDRFDSLLPHLTFNVDPQFQAGMATLDHMADALPAAQRDAYIRTMNSQFADKLSMGAGPASMAGDTFKGVESELGRRSRGLAQDPSFDNQELGRIYQQALTVFRDALQRQNPTYAPQLTALNSAYARFTRLRDAMSKLGAGEGIFTPAQLLNAVRSLDRSRGKGAFAGGDALMQDLAESGKTVLGNTYPDSGTAGRAMVGALGLGGAAHFEPHAAAGLAATTIPYLPYVRNWFSSPFAQDAGALLRQVNPALASQAGQQAKPYIGQQ